MRKPANLKVEVYKKALELFKKIRESSSWQQLEQMSQDAPEQKQVLEQLNNTEKKLREY